MRGSGGADHHRRSVEYIASSVDGARLVVVEGARHFGPHTHPTEVADVIRDAAARSIDGATG
jgi:pimeloyl-ACP methyl ester carboxylesterase